MPPLSVFLIHLLIFVAFGGLLFWHRHLSRPALATHRRSLCSRPTLGCALQSPESTAGRQPHHPSSITATPFPPPARGELILVIDDEPSVRDLLCTVLLNHGYQVAVARDGAEGLRVFSTMADQISLVLSDVYMPHISGRSFSDLIRPIRPEVPILLMSGLAISESAPEAPSVNSRDPFLLKPFKPAALLQKIHQLLHPEPAPGS